MAALQSVTDEQERLWWICVYHQRSFETLAEALDHLDRR